MIVFDLKCQHGHVFEIWFRSSTDYESQRGRGLIECPTCGSTQIEKAIMAPNVGAKTNQRSTGPVPSVHSEKPASVPAAPVAVPASKPSAEPGQTGPVAEGGAAMMPQVAEVRAFVRALNAHVKQNFEDLGDGFADEARAIHYGEAQERGIYGNATGDEIEELVEEGIEILPLPGVGKADA